jgi:hypothetical protein
MAEGELLAVKRACCGSASMMNPGLSCSLPAFQEPSIETSSPSS